MEHPAQDLLTLALRSSGAAILVFAVLGIGPAPAAAAEVTGTAAYRERIALPPDAAFEATLEDVSRADAPSMVLGRANVAPAGQVPIRFAIPYDPAKIVANHRYVVRGRILQQGRLLFTTTRAYPVLTGGAGSSVDLLLQQPGGRPAPAGGGKPAATPLAGTQWNLVEVGGLAVKPAAADRTPGFKLDAEARRMSAYGGCNTMSGGYQLEGSKLSFGNVASTMKACMEGMDVEQAFAGALNKTTGYRIAGRQLELLDGAGAVLARFTAAP